MDVPCAEPRRGWGDARFEAKLKFPMCPYSNNFNPPDASPGAHLDC